MAKPASANGRRPSAQGQGGRGRPQGAPASNRRPEPQPDPEDLDVRLRILDGPAAGTEYAIAGAVVRLGRGDDNDIVLQDNNASRLHAEVVASRGQYVVRDLGSRNGIFVNRKKVSQQQLLKNGDRITIGGTSVQFITDGGAAAAMGGGAGPAPDAGGGLKRAVLVGGAVGVVLLLLIAIAGSGHNSGRSGGSSGGRNGTGSGFTPPNDDVSLGSLLGGGQKGSGGNGIGVDRNSNTRLGTTVPVGTPSKANEAQIQTLLSQGDMAYSSGKLPDARAFYSRAALLDPSCERCKQKQLDIEGKIKIEIDHALQSGIDYFNTDRYDDARRQFEKVKMLDADPKSINNGNATNYITQIDKKLQEQR